MAFGEATSFVPPAASLTASFLSIIFDSTRGFVQGYTAAATIAAGDYRRKYAGRRVKGFVDATGNNVTLRMDYLNSAGAWVTGAASSTVTAGTTLPFSWLPSSGDYRIVTLNLGAGSEPTALTFSGCMLVDNPDSGT